jgi:CDP-glucose 4,6-dehydratase
VSARGRYAGAPVLVTGAQGFIGSWLVRRLLDAGARVVVPHRGAAAESNFRSAGLEERCQVVAVDILDRDALARVLEEHGIRAVFHLAAQSTVEVAYRDPLATFDVNVRGTYTLLDACRTTAAPVERIVVASSHLAYGGTTDAPSGVEMELRATFPYEVSKAAADAISRSYAHTYDLPVAVLRMANVYGGGDFNFTRLVPETARALVRGERPVLRSDGTPQRDFLYVEDAVDAYLAVAESLDDDAARGRAWNAGAGEPVAVLEMVRRLIAAAGHDVEPLIKGSGTPPGELDRQAVDASALRQELGWRPRWELDPGLAETYRWYERQLS